MRRSVTRSLFFTSTVLPIAGLAACSRAPETMTTSEALAVCLATDEATPISLGTAPGDTTVPPGGGDDSGGDVGDGSGGDDSGGDGGDGPITHRCCTAPDCTVHDYPPEICTSIGTQPAPEDEYVAAEMYREPWNGPDLRTMIMDGCQTDGGDDGGDGHDGGDGGEDCDGQVFYFDLNGEAIDYVAWLEDFDTDGDGRADRTDVVVGDARGAGPGAKVRNAAGTEVFPLVREGHPWYRAEAEVDLPDGPDEDTEPDEYFFDQQNDCFRVDEIELDCGTVYICWIC